MFGGDLPDLLEAIRQIASEPRFSPLGVEVGAGGRRRWRASPRTPCRCRSVPIRAESFRRRMSVVALNDWTAVRSGGDRLLGGPVRVTHESADAPLPGLGNRKVVDPPGGGKLILNSSALTSNSRGPGSSLFTSPSQTWSVPRSVMNVRRSAKSNGLRLPRADLLPGVAACEAKCNLASFVLGQHGGRGPFDVEEQRPRVRRRAGPAQEDRAVRFGLEPGRAPPCRSRRPGRRPAARATVRSVVRKSTSWLSA